MAFYHITRLVTAPGPPQEQKNEGALWGGADSDL